MSYLKKINLTAIAFILILTMLLTMLTSQAVQGFTGSFQTGSPLGRFEGGGEFITDQLIARVHRGVTSEEVAQAVATIDGEILRSSEYFRRYTIQVPINTEDGLRNLMDVLMNTYPHIFESAGFHMVDGLSLPVQPNESPTPGSEPGGGGNGPSIVVLTEFPAGEVNVPWVDIEYIAIPTPGAVITEVFYTINDEAPTYIYISEASDYTPMGELGAARVFITPQPENRFVFTVRDTAGGEASYKVANVSTFNAFHGWILPPMRAAEPHEIGIAADGTRFSKNRLNLLTVQIDNEHITPAVIAMAVAEFGGIIVTQIPMIGHYVIEFPPDIGNSEEELMELGGTILAAHPDLFLRFSLPGLYREGSAFEPSRPANSRPASFFMLFWIAFAISAIVIRRWRKSKRISD